MEFFSFSSILLLLVLSFYANPIFSLSDDQQLISSVLHDDEENCPYTVIVTTSCSSPDWSRDQITIVLGDADGNKVVAPRLDEPLSGGGGFEKCSSDTFQVKGQCLTICSLYMYRSGPDGLIPESVEIYEEGYKSVKFYFNKNIPENIWYGKNHCNNTGLPPPSPDFPPFSPTVPPPQPPYFPPYTPSIPPPSSPDFPPFTPTVPPPQPPYFPPYTPSIPPPPPPIAPPSAASGLGGGESLVVAFAAIVATFVGVVV